MSDKVTHLKRPSLDRTGPNRASGTLYRTADHEKTGIGGVTLESAEDAMIAAVRMAYDVADSQIARSKRLADRLKGAADRATGNDPDDGQGSAEDAVDAAGRLVNNAMLSGMGWVEALVGAEGGLASRLASAQLKAAKSVLFGAQRDADDGPVERQYRPQEADPPRRPAEKAPRVRIVLQAADANRRAVRIVRWEVERLMPAKLSFQFRGGATPPPGTLTGALASPSQEEDRPTLSVDSSAATASGKWRAAVCDEDGEQYGIIEIEI